MDLIARIPEAAIELSTAIAEMENYTEIALVIEQTLRRFIPVDWVGFYSASMQGAATSVTTNPHLPFNWDEKYQEIAHLDSFRQRNLLNEAGHVIRSHEFRDSSDEIENYCRDFALRYADTAHVMSLNTVKDDQRLVAINLNRCEPRKHFTTEEKCFYEGLAPVLIMASKQVLLHQDNALQRVTYEKLMGAKNRFAVVLDQRLAVLDILPGTRAFFKRAFGARTAAPLPEPIWQWVVNCVAASWRPGHLAGPWTYALPSPMGRVVCEACVIQGPLATPVLLLCFAVEAPSENFSILTKAGLTEREIQVLSFLPLGYTNRHIAMAMAISVDGVKKHLKQLSRKLQAAGRAEILYRAMSLKQRLSIFQG
ncbi:helix-turn-helix transcriptional regulator [Desulfatitalea alkaliphila]|uniref:Helix-turn-helix transcriptional regulator n=1 Tax=Desulfatitalea alkaliphila TaxID=2929485 RepID=A0AA41R339_9BACT|nr:helix-turn-helix transcriptional regulator [Desulfatitalea alkaliphila]MCJ8500215.1 helix-turn-helix transcriptional regulator [Desulfatitalea alkaliphila]